MENDTNNNSTVETPSSASAAAEGNGSVDNINEDNKVRAYEEIHAEDVEKIDKLNKRVDELEKANAKLALRQSFDSRATKSAEDILYDMFYKEGE